MGTHIYDIDDNSLRSKPIFAGVKKYRNKPNHWMNKLVQGIGEKSARIDIQKLKFAYSYLVIFIPDLPRDPDELLDEEIDLEIEASLADTFQVSAMHNDDDDDSDAEIEEDLGTLWKSKSEHEDDFHHAYFENAYQVMDMTFELIPEGFRIADEVFEENLAELEANADNEEIMGGGLHEKEKYYIMSDDNILLAPY